jgi:DNA-binding NarL/FixJ family response regulator
VGFELPSDPWRLDDQRLLCVGAVRDAADASDAVEAVTRGVSLAVHIEAGGQVRRQLLEDLHEVGVVEQGTSLDGGDAPTAGAGDASGIDVLDPDEQDLLDALVSGCTITEAAAQLHLSRRTATRRLARSRQRLGVATTAEAMSRWAAIRRAEPTTRR